MINGKPINIREVDDQFENLYKIVNKEKEKLVIKKDIYNEYTTTHTLYHKYSHRECNIVYQINCEVRNYPVEYKLDSINSELICINIKDTDVLTFDESEELLKDMLYILFGFAQHSCFTNASTVDNYAYTYRKLAKSKPNMKKLINTDSPITEIITQDEKFVTVFRFENKNDSYSLLIYSVLNKYFKDIKSGYLVDDVLKSLYENLKVQYQE